MGTFGYMSRVGKRWKNKVSSHCPPPTYYTERVISMASKGKKEQKEETKHFAIPSHVAVSCGVIADAAVAQASSCSSN